MNCADTPKFLYVPLDTAFVLNQDGVIGTERNTAEQRVTAEHEARGEVNNQMNNGTSTPAVTGLLTYNQVAEILGVSTKQVYNLVNVKKTLKAIKIGRSVRFTVQDLADFLAAHEVDTATSAASVPGQLELDFGIAAADDPASTTHEPPVGAGLAA